MSATDQPIKGGVLLLTRRELAALLGRHMQTVTDWERQGLPIAERGRKGKPSLYSEADVRAWLQMREEVAQSPAGLDLAHERALKEHWQALLAEQTHRARARELIPAAEVEKAWSGEKDAVRTKILSTYTTRADQVHRAATLEGVVGVERALKAIAYELLRELAGASVAERPRRRKKTA